MMRVPLFDSLVYRALESVPPGRVTTYGEIARALGDIRAARAVAEALSKNPFAPEVPCHRVVYGDGRIGGYAGGVEKKIALLEEEGVRIVGGKVKDFEKIIVRAEEIDTEPLFEKLRRVQEKLRERVVLEGEVTVERVAGVDVTYVGERGIALAVVVEGGMIVGERLVFFEPEIRYVPTYLAFREFPGMYLALRDLEWDLAVVDGQGIIHPRFFGIASHLGVVLDRPTIGAAKRLLFGQESDGRIVWGERKLGWHLGRKYISPGHLVSVDASRELYTSLSTHPEDLAHNRLQEVRRELLRRGAGK